MRHAQSATTRPGKADHERTDPADIRADLDRCDPSRVDAQDRQVDVAIHTQDLRALASPVGENDPTAVAAQVVGGGENAPIGDDHARTSAPARADPDDSRAGADGTGGDQFRSFSKSSHVYSLVTCKSQVTVPWG